MWWSRIKTVAEECTYESNSLVVRSVEPWGIQYSSSLRVIPSVTSVFQCMLKSKLWKFSKGVELDIIFAQYPITRTSYNHPLDTVLPRCNASNRNLISLLLSRFWKQLSSYCLIMGFALECTHAAWPPLGSFGIARPIAFSHSPLWLSDSFHWI